MKSNMIYPIFSIKIYNKFLPLTYHITRFHFYGKEAQLSLKVLCPPYLEIFLGISAHIFRKQITEQLNTMIHNTIWASLVAQLVKNPPAMWETWVSSLCWENPLQKGKANQSSILAWGIPVQWGQSLWGHKELGMTEHLSLLFHITLLTSILLYRHLE